MSTAINPTGLQQQIILNKAKKNRSVRHQLTNAKEQANDAYRLACIDLIEIVDEMQPDMKDNPLNFALAVSLLAM